MAERFEVTRPLVELPDGTFLECREVSPGEVRVGWSRAGATERLILVTGSVFGMFTVASIAADKIVLEYEIPARRTRTRKTTEEETA